MVSLRESGDEWEENCKLGGGRGGIKYQVLCIYYCYLILTITL